MSARSLFSRLIVVGALIALSTSLAAQTLEERFANPTPSAKPRVWWHWIDGNVTKEGITRDLEWMKRVGIGGFQMFDGSFGYPAMVDRPVTFMTPEWKALVRHAASEADRLGLEMTIAAAGGWSETGGPWVRPEQAMKKLVWSETRLVGGRRFTGRLPTPPTNNGPLQDVPAPAAFSMGPPETHVGPPDPTHYADVRVIAYRVPTGEQHMPEARVSASGGDPDAALLRDGRFDRAFALPSAGADKEAWIQFDFGRPTTIRSLRIALTWPTIASPTMPNGVILASDDGVTFRPVASLPKADANAFPPVLPNYTLALPETKARYFRLAVRPNGGFAFPGRPPAPTPEFRFTEADFSPAARPNRFEAKAGLAVLPDYEAAATAPISPAAAIDLKSVIDLTGRMRPDGTLDWTPPRGEWMVLRFGYSLTGVKNHPGTPAATGFEVDKYSARDVRDYLEKYYDPIAAELKGLTGERGLQNLLTDSWEAGQANWTPTMIAEFKARRGYDPTPYLPVLADRIVGGAEASDRFLWDFRRTLADLLAEAHYKTIGDFARERGLGYYGEAMGTGLPTTGDGLQAKRYTTVPMAEFWQVRPDQPSDPKHVADVREAASAAHVYGQNIVATESFTALPMFPPYSVTPWQLKPIADRFLAQGVNRFAIHTSVHQPIEKAPGFTLSVFGQHFSRHESWAEMAGPWMTYLARASELLQQGRFVGDVAYFYGEGAAVTVPENGATDPVVPAGHGYDFVNRDIVLKDLAVADGRIRAASGMTYGVLVLPANTTRLSLPLVTKLRDLVAAGARLVGPRPTGAAGLGAGDAEVAAVAAQLWGDLDGKARTVRNFGRGKVYWGQGLDAILAEEGIAPDYVFSGDGADGIVAIHRRLDDGDVYFVANQGGRAAHIDASFRVAGREAELWYPDSGRIAPGSFRQAGGRTVVPLALDPYESVFVVFRKPTGQAARTVVPATEAPLMTIGSDWSLAFMADRGAPSSIHLDRIASWTESADAGVRYYSGTGTYDKLIEVPRQWLHEGRRILLDLGDVREVARVYVNGSVAGTAWKPPYRVDITDAVKPGRNRLSIAVANLWPNRMIGDLQPEATRQYTFTTMPMPPYTKDTPLLPSGLLGPVRIIAEDAPRP